MSFHVVRAVALAAALAGGLAAAQAQNQSTNPADKTQDQGTNPAEKAQGQGANPAEKPQDQGANPVEKAQDKPTAVLVDGKLAVPGAPTQTDTVPSKYSEENAKSDKMLMLDFTFKYLTDEQRAAIYHSVQSAKGDTRPLDASYATVSVELPASTKLQPLPKDATQAAPRTKDYEYALAGDKVLLVYPENRSVVAVIGP